MPDTTTGRPPDGPQAQRFGDRPRTATRRKCRCAAYHQNSGCHPRARAPAAPRPPLRKSIAPCCRFGRRARVVPVNLAAGAGGRTQSREAVMKYALLIYAVPGASENPGPAPEGVIEDWLDYTAAIKEAGVLLGAEQLTWPDTATTVRLAEGERLLTDGPFAETKEHLLGFYLLEAGSLDVALDWAAKMPIMRYGTVEVRPVREGMRWQTALK